MHIQKFGKSLTSLAKNCLYTVKPEVRLALQPLLESGETYLVIYKSKWRSLMAPVRKKLLKAGRA